MNAAIQHFAAFPVVHVQQHQQQAVAAGHPNENDGRGEIEEVPIPYECTLSPKPQNLFELWQEYEHGIGGRKPAKNFSQFKRGQVKTIYT